MIDFFTASDIQLSELRKALIYYLEKKINASPNSHSCIIDMIRAINNEMEERGLL